MDHDGAFAADENVDTVHRAEGGSSRLGQHGLLLSEGGIEADRKRVDVNSEETPLLSSSHEDGPRKSSWAKSTEWDHLPWYKRPSPFWLLFPFLFSALAFGGIIVPKLNLILALVCREYFADKTVTPNPSVIFLPTKAFTGDADAACRTPEIQERVSAFMLQASLISGILAAIIAPKLGALSDRYGRKPIMSITNLGMLCGEVLTILAAKYPETFPVKWLLLGYFFDGLCGSFIASMSLSHSYATDCTAPEDRNVVFGYFHGALFSGIALGPLVAGYLVKWTGDNLVMFYVALGCHLGFILFLFAFIPESLPKARQFAAREKYAAEMEAASGSTWMQRLQSYNLFEPLKILYPTGPGSSAAVRRNLILLASVDAIIFGVAMGAMGIVVIYSNYMFGWATYEQSIFMSVVNTSRVFMLLVVLPGATKLYRRNGRAATSTTDTFDLSVLRVGIFFDALGFLGYTLSSSGGLFLLSGALASIGGVGSPTLQAAQTKHVPPDRIGQLLGAMGLLHAIARVVAPLVFNGIYMATVKSFPQTVFVVLTSMFVLALLVSCFVVPGVKIEEEPEDDVDRRPSRVPDNTDADAGI